MPESAELSSLTVSDAGGREVDGILYESDGDVEQRRVISDDRRRSWMAKEYKCRLPCLKVKAGDYLPACFARDGDRRWQNPRGGTGCLGSDGQ